MASILTAPAIGTQTFLTGSFPHIDNATEQLEFIERRGIDGHASREIGKRAAEVQWETEADSDDGAATAAAYHALSGMLQSITNLDGSIVAGVSVHCVDVQVRYMAYAKGGLTDGVWYVTARWRLKAPA